MATKYKEEAKKHMMELADDGVLEAMVFCVQFDEKYLLELKNMAINEKDDPDYAFTIWKKLYQVSPDVKDTGHSVALRGAFKRG